MAKKDKVSYSVYWLLGIAWLVAGLLQMLSGDEIAGMLGAMVAVGYHILARSYEK